VTLTGSTTTGAQVEESGLTGGTKEGQDVHKVTNGTLNLPTGTTAVATTGSTDKGTFEVKADGTYSYTLTTITTGDDVTDSFTYTSKDVNGNTVTNTVTIKIVDDAPKAVADENVVTEGATLTVNAVDGVLNNDKAGADGWESAGAVIGVVAGTSTEATGNVGTEITGTYGKLVLNADGSYTYVSTADAVTADAQDVFTYT
ncbi:VCBS domain-containing protein, partial [Aliarcobacter cryaerophilus]|uniref:Ig-like domain-containing protein n=1 Tax=Aliarcobacter cryaerophilus TaxID=28198 RepID=UPI0021B37181